MWKRRDPFESSQVLLGHVEDKNGIYMGGPGNGVFLFLEGKEERR